MIFNNCFHYCCIPCLQEFLKAKLDDKKSITNLSCIQHNCLTQISYDDVKYILFHSGKFALWTKYEKYLFENCVESDPNMKYCPNKGCGFVMSALDNTPMLVCPKCSYKFCFNCLTNDWHRGSTCDQYREWKKLNKNADKKFEEYVQHQGLKRCPKCREYIEKNGGCDHMTCRNCKYEWWWSTGKPYGLVRGIFG